MYMKHIRSLFVLITYKPIKQMPAALLEHTTMYSTINGWMLISNNIPNKDGSSLLYNATAKVVKQWKRGTIKAHFRVRGEYICTHNYHYKSMYYGN